MSTRQDILLKSGVQLKTGSCFFGHKWTVWRKYDQPIGRVEDGFVQFRQERECVKCGLTEDERYKI